ncbi:MAG: hypothetical protein NTY04_00500, partial [Candidatus Staskawiczbacteria bacterium]|nr:hypothetical protein [Candidatus Staskawiczbacteria bacterium]
MIIYNLMRYRYPSWLKADQQLILRISQSAFKIWHQLENDLISPMSNKFHTICEKYDTPYLLLGDILSANSSAETAGDISDPEILESLIKNAYSKRLSTLKARISRAAVYSTISIFVTKVLTLLLLEVMIERAIGAKVNTTLLTADILIPTILMFAMVATIKRPSKKNLNIVTMETMKIAYKKEGADVYEVKMSRKKGFAMKFVLSLMYVLSAFITFGAI